MVGDESGAELDERWEFGTQRVLGSVAPVRSARSRTDPTEPPRLAEAHPIPAGLDAEKLIEAITVANLVEHEAMLSVLDLGLTPPPSTANPTPDRQLIVVTESWEEPLGGEVLDESQLRSVALAVASALAALHASGTHHGGLHRGSIRRVGTSWKLAPAGMGPLLGSEIAAYRPPGLHVMEPAAPAADMWNLGVVLNELGTGRLLRPGEEPTVPGIPVIDALVGLLLQPNPAKRIGASQVVELLQRTPVGAAPAGVHQRPIDQPPTEPSPRPSRVNRSEPDPEDWPQPAAPQRRWGRRAAVGVGGVVLLTVVAATFTLPGRDPEPEQATGDAQQTSGEQVDVGDDGEETAGTVDRPDIGSAISLNALAVGDCVDIDLAQGVITSAKLEACEAIHTGEVIAVADPPEADGDYPGRSELLSFGTTRCDVEFTTYVGQPSLLTTLMPRPLVPSFAEWDSEDRRSVICLATSADREPLAIGVQGAGKLFSTRPGVETAVGKTLVGGCFELIDGELQGLGKRQGVVIASCPDLHTYETFGFSAVAVEPEDDDAVQLSATRLEALLNDARGQCDEQWAEMVMPPGAPVGASHVVFPDVFDWQGGDRFFLCVVKWPRQILGSAVLQTAFAAQNEPSDE